MTNIIYFVNNDEISFAPHSKIRNKDSFITSIYSDTLARIPFVDNIYNLRQL